MSRTTALQRADKANSKPRADVRKRDQPKRTTGSRATRLQRCGCHASPRPPFGELSWATMSRTTALERAHEANPKPRADLRKREQRKRTTGSLQRTATSERLRQAPKHCTTETKCHTNGVASGHPLATRRHAGCVSMRVYHGQEVRT